MTAKVTIQKNAVFVLLLAALTVTSCTARHPGEAEFESFLSSSDRNEGIVLDLITAEVSGAEDVYVSLQVMNNLDSRVEFPPGYGARGFFWLEDQEAWVEVENDILFPDVGYLLGASQGIEPYIGTVNFASKDPILAQASSVRILVEGSILSGDGSPRTGLSAYVDVELTRPNGGR